MSLTHTDRNGVHFNDIGDIAQHAATPTTHAHHLHTTRIASMLRNTHDMPTCYERTHAHAHAHTHAAHAYFERREDGACLIEICFLAPIIPSALEPRHRKPLGDGCLTAPLEHPGP